MPIEAQVKSGHFATVVLTPDMDANSLGGTVDVKTLSAFDLPRSLLSAGVSVSRDSLSRQTSPAASLLGATRLLDGTLGIAAALNVDERKFGSEDVETDGRRAKVRFGRDFEHDARRRDFTMNALYASEEIGRAHV